MNESRRIFLKTGLAAAAVSHPLLAQAAAPKRKLRIAGIGVGGMGFNNLTNLAAENIVALCDVDQVVAKRSFDKWPDAKRWTDFREMLEKQDDIEAVMIATPDHTHASIAMAALKAGKHVYCQKPLTHDIHESRLLAAAAAEAKDCVAVMGNQHHSSGGARKVVDWVRAGLIGKVERVIAWCSLTYRPWGHAGWSTLTDTPPSKTPPVPDTLDWDLWSGPAEVRPYHPTYHPARWRAWWDYGCGMMGDRGVHTLDASCWALDLMAPSSVERLMIEGENEHVHPDKAHIRYQFPARGLMAPLQLDWYSGLRPAEADEITGDHKPGDEQGGAVIIGSEGMITHGTYPGNSLTLLPASLKKEAAGIKSELPNLRGSHEMIWAAACKGEGPVSSGFEYAAGLNELTHIGNLAIRLGGKIEWDAEKGEAPGTPEAAQYVRMPRRKGWELD
jgi:predicted dehydrogenase